MQARWRIGDKIASEAEARLRQSEIDRVTTQTVESKPGNHIVAVAKVIGAVIVFVGSRAWVMSQGC